MFIEITHDQAGNILACYIADTAPNSGDIPAVEYSKQTAGRVQARAIIEDADILAELKNIPSKAVFIVENLRVDLPREISLPPQARIPAGMKMRGLLRRSL